MANSSSGRSRTEMRKKRRQPLHYGASILTDADAPPLPCTIADVSESGVQVVLQSEDELPPRFTLLLNEKGEALRRCRLVWRRGSVVGAAFERD